MTDLSIPESLKEIRRQPALTQGQLAHRSDASFMSVNHWERGRRRPIPIALDNNKTRAGQANIDVADFTEAQQAGR